MRKNVVMSVVCCKGMNDRKMRVNWQRAMVVGKSADGWMKKKGREAARRMTRLYEGGDCSDVK